jgi:hypothetical protein
MESLTRLRDLIGRNVGEENAVDVFPLFDVALIPASIFATKHLLHVLSEASGLSEQRDLARLKLLQVHLDSQFGGEFLVASIAMHRVSVRPIEMLSVILLVSQSHQCVRPDFNDG